MAKTTIKGKIVSYEEDVRPGLRYLMYEIDKDQVKVFFHHAFNHSSAEFEDHQGRKYKLIRHGGEYELVKDK